MVHLVCGGPSLQEEKPLLARELLGMWDGLRTTSSGLIFEEKNKKDLDTYVYILLNKSTFVCHSSWLSMIICFVRGPSRRNLLPISKSGVSLYLNTNVFVTRCFIFDQKYCFVSEPKHFFIHIFHILFCTWLNIFHISYYIILYLNPNLFSYIFAKHFVLYLIK